MRDGLFEFYTSQNPSDRKDRAFLDLVLLKSQPYLLDNVGIPKEPSLRKEKIEHF